MAMIARHDREQITPGAAAEILERAVDDDDPVDVQKSLPRESPARWRPRRSAR
jgi:hypothetical protein